MLPGLPVLTTAPRRGLHAGPQPALGGSEDDVVSGDVASDSSDVDVLGGL